MSVPKRATWFACAALICASLAACGDEDDDSAVELRDIASCDEVACEGEINGAAYELSLPDRWNGTLLIYSHGYRQAQPAPPNFDIPSTDAVAAPTDDVTERLLGLGFALAGSAYAENGWAVAEGVEAGQDLHDFFVDEVAEPDRVYVWGDSLGGLITQMLAQGNPDWVDGAAPLCGVLGGINDNLDLALDLAYSVRQLFYPPLKLTDYASWNEAVQNWLGAAQAVQAAADDLTTGPAKIRLISALTDAPSQSFTQDGNGASSALQAQAEAILTGLGYGTFGRYDIEQRVNGNPSGNDTVDYATRIDAAERSQIDSLSGGRTDELLAMLEAGRVAFDSEARRMAEDLGIPDGSVEDPTITLHTGADPLVLVQNQSRFLERVDKAGDADLLRQLFTTAPSSYEEAPYGAGHCNFTADERVAVLNLLDEWVRSSEVPDDDRIREAFGARTGLNLQFEPGPWPAGSP